MGGHKPTYTDVYDMSKEGKLRLKIWSPRVGLKLTAKFENDVPWPVVGTAEVIGTTTKASEWEEMVLDFQMLRLLLEITGQILSCLLIMVQWVMVHRTSLFILMMMQSGTTHSVIADFEVLPTLSGFDGEKSTIIDNPDKNGNSG